MTDSECAAEAILGLCRWREMVQEVLGLDSFERGRLLRELRQEMCMECGSKRLPCDCDAPF